MKIYMVVCSTDHDGDLRDPYDFVFYDEAYTDKSFAERRAAELGSVAKYFFDYRVDEIEVK